jgi:hypothetical protein
VYLKNSQHLKTVNIVPTITLTVLTLGLYYFVWQYRQLKQINILLESDEHSFFKWFFLSLITLGLYHIYHEYVASQQILEIQKKYSLNQSPEQFALFCLLLSIFGMVVVPDIVHQEEINKIIIGLKK